MVVVGSFYLYRPAISYETAENLQAIPSLIGDYPITSIWYGFGSSSMGEIIEG